MEEYPEHLLYSESHEYLLVEANIATIGITDYATEQLGDIVYVELPEVGTFFTTGDSMGVVESVKAVSDLFIPVSGKVIEVNEELIDQPELVSEDAYERGWLIKLELDEPIEGESLMDAAEYASFVSAIDVD